MTLLFTFLQSCFRPGVEQYLSSCPKENVKIQRIPMKFSEWKTATNPRLGSGKKKSILSDKMYRDHFLLLVQKVENLSPP